MPKRLRFSFAAFTLMFLLAPAVLAAEPFLEKLDLFTAGEGGYKRYHIPGAVVTAKGTVLAWCEARLNELGARPSVLNPLWYAGSFGIGAVAAMLGDKASLGFVAETEHQVEGHLKDHLDRLPAEDQRSRAIVEAMRHDEIGHGKGAQGAGGLPLPRPVRELMRRTARIMTHTAYRF